MWRSMAPETGAPFDPKASCSGLGSRAAFVGSISLDPIWRSKQAFTTTIASSIHVCFYAKCVYMYVSRILVMGFSHFCLGCVSMQLFSHECSGVWLKFWSWVSFQQCLCSCIYVAYVVLPWMKLYLMKTWIMGFFPIVVNTMFNALHDV